MTREEFAAADIAYKTAYRAYIPIRDHFRCGRIRASEYMVARKTFDAACAAWDAAYAKAQESDFADLEPVLDTAWPPPQLDLI